MSNLPRRPWVATRFDAVSGVYHDLSKHPKNILPNFDLDNKETHEDHVRKTMLVISLMSVQHEYVVCRLFPYTFERKSSTWYFSLPQGSITNWNDFGIVFMKKFGEDKTPATLVLELPGIKMNPKEKIKYSNQIL